MSTDPSANLKNTVTSGSLGDPNPEPELYEATDKEMIIFFFACGVNYSKKLKKYGHKTIFWFEKAKIADPLRIWQSPEPIMMDVRKLFAAERIFYSAIHDD